VRNRNILELHGNKIVNSFPIFVDNYLLWMNLAAFRNIEQASNNKFYSGFSVATKSIGCLIVERYENALCSHLHWPTDSVGSQLEWIGHGRILKL
jgi:hypothetical protein